MRTSIKILFPLCIIVLLWGCKDTCNTKYGKTFNSVLIDEAMYDGGGVDVVMSFNTSTLDGLPSEYFDEANLYANAAYELALDIDSVYTSNTTLKLTLNSSFVPSVNNSTDLSYVIIFNDRRSYLDCKHPGQNDSYQLNLGFTLKNIGGNQFELSNLEWNEEAHKGAI